MADTMLFLSLSACNSVCVSISISAATPSLPKDQKMLLKPQTSSFSLQTLDLERKTKTRINSNSVFHSFTSTALQNVNGVARLSQRFAHNAGASFVGVKASKEADNKRTILDIVFEPFEEVKKELLLVPSFPQASVARHKYTDPCEAAINEQINVEYNVSYVYHALYAYFDRDNVALKGIARFFKESSEEERQHAQKLMEYQNKRGGKVKLQSMMKPMADYDHLEKGDALYAMELALSLEKLTNEKLVNLHKVAEENDDEQI